MIYNVCLKCGTQRCACGLSKAQWRNPLVGISDAVRYAVGERDVVIGDPTNFGVDTDSNGNSYVSSYLDFDRGWDIDVGNMFYESINLCEYEEEWKNKIVRHPKTGFSVKVGSLTGDDQEKHKPSRIDIPHSVVSGGVVIDREISLGDFKKTTKNMGFKESLYDKSNSIVRNIYNDRKSFCHLFRLSYDGSEDGFSQAIPDRASKIVHVGVFKGYDYSKKYAESDDKEKITSRGSSLHWTGISI